MSFQEDDNGKYADIEYWNKRYADEDHHDWLGDYNVLKPIFNRHIRFEDRVLIVGCGNSLLGRQMWDDGYKSIVNSDLSEVCIKRQRNIHSEAGYDKLEWMVMDACNMSAIGDGQFDVVIEKATVDVFLVKEKSPWPSNYSQEALGKIDRCLSEASRILKPEGGKFLSITWHQPHFRMPLLSKPKYGWCVQSEGFSSFLDYVCFVMTKGQVS